MTEKQVRDIERIIQHITQLGFPKHMTMGMAVIHLYQTDASRISVETRSIIKLKQD